MTAAPGVRIIHHIPGRVRMRLAQGRRDPAMLRDMCDLVKGFGGVRSVEINPATGSILVHYDPATPEELQGLLQTTQAVPDVQETGELVEEIQKDVEFLANRSEAARAIVDAVKAVNREIRAATGNAVDLNVLVPAAFAVWALLKSRTEAATPLWLTLGLFSFHSFVALHAQPVVHMSARETTITNP